MSHIHIPDGVLPVWLWAAGWVLALAAVTVAAWLAGRRDMRRKVPLLGVVSALMLVSMSSEIIPIAYHINLTVLAGILLGPVLAVIAAFIVDAILAMLGHGGVTVLGLNTLIVAAEMMLGWALFHGILRLVGRKRAALGAGVATVLTLAVTTTALVGIVWLGGSGATARETGALDPADLRFENPFAGGVFGVGLLGGDEHGHGEDADGHDEAEHEPGEDHEGEVEGEDGHADEQGSDGSLSVGRFAAVVYTLGPIGWLVEALITAGIVGYVARVRPKLVFTGALSERRRSIPGDEAGGM